MFARKKEGKEGRRSNANRNLSKYGLLDIPGVDDSGFDMNENDDDDDALEAELLALTSGTTPNQRRKRPPPAPPTVNLDSMVAESLKDVPSDDDGSVDENDPALLNELNYLVEDDDDVEEAETPTQSHPKTEVSSERDMLSLLRERQKMYEEAERNAKSSGETVRARRFARGLKTLNDMIKQASAGRVVNEEEIPPPVVTSTKRQSSTDMPSDVSPAPMVPSRPAPPPPPVVASAGPVIPPAEELIEPARENLNNFTGDNSPGARAEDAVSPVSVPANANLMQMLFARRNEFKEAALAAKRSGDSEKALRYVKVVKQFEPVIAAAAAGQPVDLNTIPPSPQEYNSQGTGGIQSPVKEDSEQQKSPDNAANMIGEAAEMMANAAAAAQEGNAGAEEPSIDAPPAPTTILEALEQRLAKYKSVEQAAKDEGNSSKVRRMGRIVKQYESAIKMHKAGKPIPIDELPTPPGFGPIPVEGAGTPATVPATAPATVPGPAAASDSRPAPAHPPDISEPTAGASSPDPQSSGVAAKANVRKSPQSRQEKQLALLLSRQKKFREAAVEAKRKGEINQAKEYLRITKGFDPLIEASQNGLPIDLASLPVPPENKVELETDFDIVTIDDCIPGSNSEIYEKLEEDLLRQTKMCLTTRDHFKATGDIASANRFEQLAVHSKKDLDAVRCAHKRSDPIPKFHYETRTFNIVQCCTELGDNDLELSVVQGINFNVPNPKEVDTYVKYEFPYPTEAPLKDRTGIIKDTNNPQYNQTFLLSIQRNVRACQRVFKRQAIKLEVWSRGTIWHRLCCFVCYSGTNRDSKAEQSRGFFRGDSLIGTATVKLMPLETKCIIHDAFDLMDGRKTVGGKLEVKVRVRNPILTKQVEKVQEKWLVIDQYL